MEATGLTKPINYDSAIELCDSLHGKFPNSTWFVYPAGDKFLVGMLEYSVVRVPIAQYQRKVYERKEV